MWLWRGAGGHAYRSIASGGTGDSSATCSSRAAPLPILEGEENEEEKGAEMKGRGSSSSSSGGGGGGSSR